MIDLAALRDAPERFEAAWRDRGLTVDVAALCAVDAEVRALKHQAESTKAQANAASKAIGQAAKAGQDVAAAREHARELGDRAKQFDEQRAAREVDLEILLLNLPNLCLDSVPVGSDASANHVVATWGEPPQLPAEPQPHWEIATRLGLIDFDRGARLSGSGFVAYRGLGARLQRGLIAYFLARLTERHGYEEWQVPHLVRPEILRGTGQLPKFADQLYRCEGDDLWLIPTAEVPLTNLFAGEILDASALPMRLCAYTPCFRREAGAAGIGTRGITRMHQFDKVEMVHVVAAEDSPTALETMRGHAEELLRELGLHYRVLLLCTGDTGFGSAMTYDLEVWSPGTGTWLEVSSCSNCGDFQARRLQLRHRGEAGAKPRLVHTLNGSGLALPRVLIALLESGLQADGSVVLPEPLRPFLGGLDRIPAK